MHEKSTLSFLLLPPGTSTADPLLSGPHSCLCYCLLPSNTLHAFVALVPKCFHFAIIPLIVDIFRMTRSFTQVCKRRLQGWVLDFMWKRTETPLKFKDEEVWTSTLVPIVCILKHTDGLKFGFSLDLDSTKPVSAALTIKPRC